MPDYEKARRKHVVTRTEERNNGETIRHYLREPRREDAPGLEQHRHAGEFDTPRDAQLPVGAVVTTIYEWDGDEMEALPESES